MADAGCFPAPAKCVWPKWIRLRSGRERIGGGCAPAARRLRIQRLLKDRLPSESEAPTVAKASGGQAEFPAHVRGMARVA